MTLPNKRTVFALCVVLVALYFGQYVSTASIKSHDVLASLIKSGGCLVSLEFQNQRIQPDVRINGIDVPKCTGGIPGSYIVGTSLVIPSNFCSPTTNVTLYPGNPPFPQTFTGLELCTRFLHVEPTRESEENNHLAYISIIIIIVLLSPGNIFGIYLYCKNRSRTKKKDETGNAGCSRYQQLRRSACFKKLTELINKMACSSTPSINWKCLCEKQCFLHKPNLFNYDGKSYAIFVVKNESERSNCIDPHLEKYQQNFHVANVFVVYMNDVETATSADRLPVWYKESCKWDRSLLKDKVFLPMPVSQPSPSGNSASRVMANSGPIQELTKIPEVPDQVLTKSPVQDMQQTTKFSDYHDSEENVQKTVDAVTGEDPDKTATILGNTLIRRNPSSRSLARSDGGELCENTTSQGDTLKSFTGERAEFKEIDNEDTEC